MSELYNKVEAVLFASGKPMTIKEIKRITKADNKDINKAITSLQKRYDETTSIMIEKQGESWKMTIREKYIHLIRKIVTDTELTKTVMETLAVVAWKSPVTQSDIIKIRTNKAYEHLSELKEAGFIEATKHGRTKLLKLTSKFYEYFDIDGDKDIKKMLGGFSSATLPQKKMNDFDAEIDKELELNDEPNQKEETIEIVDEITKDSEAKVEIVKGNINEELNLEKQDSEQSPSVEIVEEPTLNVEVEKEIKIKGDITEEE